MLRTLPTGGAEGGFEELVSKVSSQESGRTRRDDLRCHSSHQHVIWRQIPSFPKNDGKSGSTGTARLLRVSRLLKQALETRHYDGGAGGFIINLGSCSVLAAGAVVCGAASEFARPDRFGAGRAWSAALAGETHTPVIGVDDVWGAVLVGIGGDEADGLIEDGRQVPVKACQPGARDPVRAAGGRYTGPV